MFDVFPSPQNPTDSQPSRYLKPEEAARIWNEVYGGSPDVESVRGGCRIIHAWRLTRLLAHRQGRLEMTEPFEVLLVDGDMREATPCPAPLRRCTSDDPEHWSLGELLHRDGGLPLLPPGDTELRRRFCLALDHMAFDLGLATPTRYVPLLGDFGLEGLLDPDTAAEVWPRVGLLLQFEQRLVHQLRALVVRWSPMRVTQHLRDLLNLTGAEANGLIAQARALLRREVPIDQETTKSMVVATILDGIDQAQDAMDLSSKIKLINLWMRATGLTRVALDGDEQEELINIVRRHSEPAKLGDGPRLAITTGEEACS